MGAGGHDDGAAGPGGAGPDGVDGGVERAAGGVLWRASRPSRASRTAGAPAAVEVAVVHRPKYGDWSLPKGKLDPGEGFLDAAVREVREETGYDARPGVALGEVRYRIERGGQAQDKVVRYWAMRAGVGAFAPSREVDELRWLAPSAAAALVTHDRDRDVLDRFAARTGTTPGAIPDAGAVTDPPP